MIDKVGEQLPTVGTTVAGLILVFMGMVLSAWDSYDSLGKRAVRARYRNRIWLSFFGFIFSVGSAALGLIGIWLDHKPAYVDWLGVVALAVSFLLIAIAAFIAVKEISRGR